MLRFYNDIYAYLLKNYNSDDPRWASICVVALIHILHLSLLLLAFEYLTHVSLLNVKSKYYSLLFTIPWLLILFNYYSEERSRVLLQRFNQKKRSAQMRWGVMSVLSIFVPLVLVLVLISKTSMM